MPLQEKLLLVAVFIHVALILITGFALGGGRVAAVRSGEVRVKDIALDGSRWPEHLRKRANNYQNQFELPVLFYVLVALLVATNLIDAVQVLLAWIFIALRLLHSFIHMGTNNVRNRFYAFAASAAVLSIMWIWFALRVLAVGS